MLDLHHFEMPKLREEDCDSDSIRRQYLRQHCQLAVKNLIKNNFSAYYCDSIVDARNTVLSLIPDGGIVGCGDSHTVFALELDEELKKKNCVAIPHTCAVNAYAMEHSSPVFKVIGNRKEMRDILMKYNAGLDRIRFVAAQMNNNENITIE